MKEIKFKENFNKKIYIVLFLILSLLFAVPSIVYLIKNKTVYRFIWMRTYLFRLPTTQSEKLLNALLFFRNIFIIVFSICIYIKKA